MTPIKGGLYEFNRDALIETRKLLGISQGRMAELLEVPANTLSRWETGATVPDAGSLAAIYSLAREHGLNPPNFFSVRKIEPTIKMSSSFKGQDLTEVLSFYRALNSYLKTEIEINGSAAEPIVTVRVKNTAPDTSFPRVVFTGVGLSLSHTGRDTGSRSRLVPKVTRVDVSDLPENTNTPWANDSKMKGLLESTFQRTDNKSFPDLTPDEGQHGEVLRPGQAVQYEITISKEKLPYLRIKTEGTVSRRHLFHFEETFEMPESMTKPLAIDALMDFNAIDIHQPLTTVIDSMPEFSSDISLSEVNAFKELLSQELENIASIQGNINGVFRQHSISWFNAHLRAAYIYLDTVKASFSRLKEAIESNDLDKIAAEASTVLSLKGIANQYNRETEGLMTKFNIAEEEVNYRYRKME